jgi:hypothetical protein
MHQPAWAARAVGQLARLAFGERHQIAQRLLGAAALTQSTLGSSVNWPIATMSPSESNDGLCRIELMA